MVLKKVGELWDKLVDEYPENIYPLGYCFNGDVLINKKKLTPKNCNIRIGDIISMPNKVKDLKVEDVFPYTEVTIKCGMLSIPVENLLTPESRDALFFSTDLSIWGIYEKDFGDQEDEV